LRRAIAYEPGHSRINSQQEMNEFFFPDFSRKSLKALD
jgi:hypothetical protein